MRMNSILILSLSIFLIATSAGLAQKAENGVVVTLKPVKISTNNGNESLPQPLPETNKISYPERALPDHPEGVVRLLLRVAADGSVIRTEALDNGGDSRLLNAAVSGIREMKFRPGRSNGENVEMEVIAEIEFSPPAGMMVATPDLEGPIFADLRNMDDITSIRQSEPVKFGDFEGLKEAEDNVPNFVPAATMPQFDPAQLASNVEYPDSARKQQLQGVVYVRATIDKQGKVTQAIVTKRQPDTHIFDQAAINAVKATPFTPALNNQIPIPMSMTIPVRFILDNSDPEDLGVLKEVDSEVRLEKKEEADTEKFPEFLADAIMPTYDPAELGANVVYPEKAREAGIQGTVYVKAAIDKKGVIRKVSVVRSVDPLLNKAAMDAIRKTAFMPATQNGYPVNMTITIPIAFKLEE